MLNTVFNEPNLKGRSFSTGKSKVEILETDDYSKFKSIRGNRKIRTQYVNGLVRSMAESNLMALNPIIVNQNMEIIDGQHRLEVAKKLKIPVYYVIADFATLGDVTLLNANLHSWQTQDYLESFVDRGQEDYIKLQEYVIQTGLPIMVGVQLLMNRLVSEGGKVNLMRIFKSGEFKITTPEFAEETAAKLTELKPFTEDTIWKNREFIRAILTCYKVIKHEELMAQFAKQSVQITKKPNALGYIRAIEDVYNFNRKNKVRLY